MGLTDLSARVYIRKQLGDNLVTFATPFALFTEMETNVEGSFLQRHTWQELLAAKKSGKEPPVTEDEQKANDEFLSAHDHAKGGAMNKTCRLCFVILA